jgi:hypothetical protein
VLDAKICGIDNSIYAIDEDSTKWVTINDSFSDMNMKIMEEGNSISKVIMEGGKNEKVLDFCFVDIVFFCNFIREF